MSKLIAYRIHATGQRIVAGRSRRRWMDETHHRYAYRCLPLTIANAMGWEIRFPADVSGRVERRERSLRRQGGKRRPVWRPEQLANVAFRPRRLDVSYRLSVPNRSGGCAVGAGSAQPGEGRHRAAWRVSSRPIGSHSPSP